jgi:hypothetical protein
MTRLYRLIGFLSNVRLDYLAWRACGTSRHVSFALAWKYTRNLV